MVSSGSGNIRLLQVNIITLPILGIIVEVRVKASLILAIAILWLRLLALALAVVYLTLRATRHRVRAMEGTEAGDNLLGRCRNVHQRDGAV